MNTVYKYISNIFLICKYAFYCSRKLFSLLNSKTFPQAMIHLSNLADRHLFMCVHVLGMWKYSCIPCLWAGQEHVLISQIRTRPHPCIFIAIRAVWRMGGSPSLSMKQLSRAPDTPLFSVASISLTLGIPFRLSDKQPWQLQNRSRRVQVSTLFQRALPWGQVSCVKL